MTSQPTEETHTPVHAERPEPIALSSGSKEEGRGVIASKGVCIEEDVLFGGSEAFWWSTKLRRNGNSELVRARRYAENEPLRRDCRTAGGSFHGHLPIFDPEAKPR